MWIGLYQIMSSCSLTLSKNVNNLVYMIVCVLLPFSTAVKLVGRKGCLFLMEYQEVEVNWSLSKQGLPLLVASLVLHLSQEIGRGSFGIVYRGKLESRSCNVVAVKKLDRLAQDREKEFKTELSAIGKTCHKNLVRLIGFCDEGTERMLVYEFMSNGSLANILFAKMKPVWDLRGRFALGIARGLVYLHEESNAPIIHCDIKPHNILIDDHFNAKISDFGLAKLLLSDQSRPNTMIRGTRGYVAPEWFRNVPLRLRLMFIASV